MPSHGNNTRCDFPTPHTKPSLNTEQEHSVGPALQSPIPRSNILTRPAQEATAHSDVPHWRVARAGRIPQTTSRQLSVDVTGAVMTGSDHRANHPISRRTLHHGGSGKGVRRSHVTAAGQWDGVRWAARKDRAEVLLYWAPRVAARTQS